MDSRYITSAAKPQQLESLTCPRLLLLVDQTQESLLFECASPKKESRTNIIDPRGTQMVNFFGLNNQIIFADLPGYGYNVASKRVEGKWDLLMGAYCERDDIASCCSTRCKKGYSRL